MDLILKIERLSFPKSPYSQSTFLQLFAVYPDTFLVYETAREGFPSNSIQGYILFSEEGHLISLAIHPDFRRKGIGTALLETAARILVSNELWAEVRQGNRGALDFYRRRGFQIMGRIPGYYGDEDAWVLWLDTRKGPGSPPDPFLDRERKGG
jgi:ribosomal-protein-alanine N-acetyltransferase